MKYKLNVIPSYPNPIYLSLTAGRNISNVKIEKVSQLDVQLKFVPMTKALLLHAI